MVMTSEPVESNDEDIIVDLEINPTVNQQGFIQGFPQERDEVIQQVAGNALSLPILQAEARKSARMEPVLSQEITPIKPIEIDPTLQTDETVKEFLVEAKTYEEETGKSFSFEELEMIFAEYIRYLSDCKRTMVQYKNKTKEIFHQTVKHHAESYRKPEELILSMIVAGAHIASAGVSFKSGIDKVDRQTFINGCTSAAKGGEAVSGWLSVKNQGPRAQYQIMAEAGKTHQDDINQAGQLIPRKQDEAVQKENQRQQSKSDAARQMTQN